MRTRFTADAKLRPIGMRCGAVAEWSKALAWKVSMGQKPIEGSNPSRSATAIELFRIVSEATRFASLPGNATPYPNQRKGRPADDWPSLFEGGDG